MKQPRKARLYSQAMTIICFFKWAIGWQFTQGEVRVVWSSVETGESEESVTSEYNGPDLEIGFNAQYLLDFLRAVPQDYVSFELKDQKSAGEMRPAADA